MRRKLIAGNWKMNKTAEEAVRFLEDFKVMVKGINDVDIVLCPPSTAIPAVKKELAGTGIRLGAQNMHFEDKGAFTGEISPVMVKEFCDYVIVGHSERRQLFAETDEIVNKKIRKALEHRLKVIFCLGESLNERDNGTTKGVVERQLEKGLSGIEKSALSSIVIAYEPVWAIGTGQTATPAQAEEVHKYLRDLIASLYSKDEAHKAIIIYGGSVKPENAAEIMAMEDVDGCLPGGASLDPKALSEIIRAARPKK